MSPEYRSGIAEGLAYALTGIGAGARWNDRQQTINDMAGWLVVNGGDQFVLDLAAAISRERHPANEVAS